MNSTTDERPYTAWAYAAPTMLVGLPILIGAILCSLSQIYWQYGGPKRGKPRTPNRDREDQDAGGMSIPEDEQSLAEGPEDVELRERPGSSRLSKAEEGLEVEDPDAITALPPMPPPQARMARETRGT